MKKLLLLKRRGGRINSYHETLSLYAISLLTDILSFFIPKCMQHTNMTQNLRLSFYVTL